MDSCIMNKLVIFPPSWKGPSFTAYTSGVEGIQHVKVECVESSFVFLTSKNNICGGAVECTLI